MRLLLLERRDTNIQSLVLIAIIVVVAILFAIVVVKMIEFCGGS